MRVGPRQAPPSLCLTISVFVGVSDPKKPEPEDSGDDVPAEKPLSSFAFGDDKVWGDDPGPARAVGRALATPRPPAVASLSSCYAPEMLP